MLWQRLGVLIQRIRLKKADMSKELENTLLCEEIQWRQKSRALWLKERDRNTWFFHKVADSHCRYNRVEALRINGSLTYNSVEIKKAYCAVLSELIF
jgi:hypothetical protein